MKELIYNKTVGKKEIKNIINWFIHNYGTIRATKLVDKLKEIGFQYATESGISLSLSDLKIPDIKNVLLENTEKKFKKFETQIKKGKKNEESLSEKYIELWNQTNEIMKEEILNNLKQVDLLNPVYMILLSGARGNILQIKQLIGLRGLMVDSQGDIINIAIKNNLKEGLNIIEYFISCYGARKGLIDTSLKTANTGYLTRKLVYASQNQIVIQSNCHTRKLDIIIVKNKNKNNYKNTITKIIGRTLGKSIIIKKICIAIKGQDICHYIAKKIMKTNKIYIKSPLTCKLNNGICQICYGWDLAYGRMVELGENVGIIAAQSIGEPGTQLTMRTFHTGGIFSSESAQTVLSKYNGKIYYNTKEGIKIIKTKYKEKLFLTLKEKKLVLIKNKKIKSIIILPQYSLIFPKNKKSITKKQIIAEITNWQKITQLKKNIEKNQGSKDIKTKISGEVTIENLPQDHLESKKNRKLWIINLNIQNYDKIKKNLTYEPINKLKFQLINKTINYKHINNKNNLRSKNKLQSTIKKINQIKILNIKNTMKNLTKKINYPIKNITKQENKILIEKKYTSKRISTKSILKAGSFLTKFHKLDLKNLNHHSLFITEKYKNSIKTIKSNINILPTKIDEKIKNKSAVKKQKAIFKINYTNKKSTDIVQGLPKIEQLFETKRTLKSEKNPLQKRLEKEYYKLRKIYSQKIATRKSIYKIQKSLVKKIQAVYISQNINISNKHIEIIVKQMTSKAIVKYAGTSNLLKGEIIEINKLERINKKLIKKVKYSPLIIGISKLTKLNNSFLTAASFQDTSKILTNAAIEGKIDWLYGLKENIIFGNIIPSGTGYRK